MESLGQQEYQASDTMMQPSDTMMQSSAPFITENSGSLPLGLVGGLVAAIAGGVVWSLVLILLDYELGIVAWGIGFVCAFGVVTLGGGRGLPMQAVAIVTSIVGILIGKYGMFYYYLKQNVAEEYGLEAAATVTLYSTKVMIIFAEELGSMVGGYDLLWVALAVGTAWKVAGANTSAPETTKPAEA